MRKQYYFRPSPAGLLAWDVDRLVELSRNFTVRAVPLEEIRELDDALFGPDEAPTWRSFAAHCRLVQEAELRYPIIRAADGSVHPEYSAVKLSFGFPPRRLVNISGYLPLAGQGSADLD